MTQHHLCREIRPIRSISLSSMIARNLLISTCVSLLCVYACRSTNIYDLLENDQQHSKKPQAADQPGKPDKSDNRRSVPKSLQGALKAGATGEPHAQQPRHRVDDRDRSGRGGDSRGGGRGGRGGNSARGRGGYHGSESDGVHRNFDRKQGEHHKHAPGEARKHGAVGEVNPSSFHGSAGEFASQDAANIAEANGDIVGDEILDITPIPTEPEDTSKTYDEYIASKAKPDDDVNRQLREVIVDEENFKPVRAFKREEEDSFFDAVRSPKNSSAASAEGGEKKKGKKGKISLDEFVGVAGPTSAAESGEREGAYSRGGGRGGRGGGRGGFDGESRGGSRGGRGGGRGSFSGEGGRGGGRGGQGGAPRGGAAAAAAGGAPRGGRGGFQARGGAAGANVNIADQSAFPALSPK
jgi:hypothetical protein